ncbi:MAG: very short patch repair endonuclease [Spirochaetota bacterium]
MDVFDKRTRSAIMSKVRGKDTQPEKSVRSLIHGLGYRFRKNKADLPGKPDIVLAKHRKVVFVNGCFWHGHKNCPKSRLPVSNEIFWKNKISSNIRRDQRVLRTLKSQGWKVLVIWECQIRNPVQLRNKIEKFLKPSGATVDEK